MRLENEKPKSKVPTWVRMWTCAGTILWEGVQKFIKKLTRTTIKPNNTTLEHIAKGL